MNRTSIEWTDFTANPIRFRAPDGRVVWACEKVSPGCTHCYAEQLSRRYKDRRAGDWNAATMATLTPFLDEKELHRMLTYKPASGKKCFIGDMTDIFGEWVPDDLLNRLFSQVLELRQDVTWQLLTKRADRLHRYLSWRYGPDDEAPRGRIPSRNIHVGVSVEDQPRYDERIGKLLRTPAAVRFLSVEPMLGPIDMRMGGMSMPDYSPHDPLPQVDWCIVGGESGPGARPCDVAWARSIVQQCQVAGVPVFVKQLGSTITGLNLDGPPHSSPPRRDGFLIHWTCREDNTFGLGDRKGGNPFEWPEDLRVRQFPDASRSRTADVPHDSVTRGEG